MIRLATLDDLPAILDLGELMHAESRFKALPFARDKVAALFARIITSLGAIHLATRDGVIVGGIAGVVVEHWFSTTRVAQDFGLFITPSERGGILAVRLLKRYEAWAFEQGAQAVEMGINTGLNLAGTGRMLELVGFKLVATLHAKEAI